MKAMKLLLASAVCAMGLTAVPAQALNFVLTDTGGAAAGTQARLGFDIATRYWSSVFTDNVTVNLNIGFRSLAPGVLGSTGSARALLSMTQGYAGLANDAKSALDVRAVTNLPELGASVLDDPSFTFGAVAAVANALNPTGDGYISGKKRIDADGGVNNSTLAITKASAKALGLTTDVNGRAINYNSADASVTFSSNFGFDFDPTNGIAAGTFDFIGVAIHEIGHALGFVSGVDSYDAFSIPNGPNAAGNGTLENFVVMNSLDLFRYQNGVLDWSTGGNPYISLDGGVTQLFGDSRLSSGQFNGDGRQASHWIDSAFGVPQLGIMDPTSARGQTQEITALDLAAFDAIGWDVNFDVLKNSGYRYSTADAFRAFAAVPEPATWAMMMLGFGFVGGAMRYRRKTTKISFA